jgi:N-acyl-D-amino-acid deacylase
MRHLLGSAILVALAAGTPAGVQKASYDLVIVGGTVIDGTGAPPREADVAIAGGRIVRIGGVDRSAARETIDAAGLVVAPGFIDVHTHADDLADRPFADNYVRMGVTTIVAGNCGGSTIDVAEALARVRQVGASVNFATLVGHNTVRRAIMGTDARPPSPVELSKMKALVWKAMADGAVGFSTGLEYVPGAYADTAEIIELARVSATAGGLYASHMRNEGTALEQAVQETIRVGEASGSRVQVSHLKVDSPNRWGASAKALELIDAARARGIDVAADQYAYTAASSGLAIRFPAWVLEGGPPRIGERLNHAATWSRIRAEMRDLLAARGLVDLSFASVAAHAADPSLNGLTMKQVAVRLTGDDSVDAQLEAARLMMLKGGASMVYHLMSDEDVVRIMRHPHVGIASDSSVLPFGEGVPHPRGYGNNVRVLGEYVRQRRVILPEEAVRKMTSLPAGHFRFAGRGVLRAGHAADVVLFDAREVGDRATFEHPHQYAAGVPWVLVNGVVVVRQGQHTRARPGQVLTLDDQPRQASTPQK